MYIYLNGHDLGTGKINDDFGGENDDNEKSYVIRRVMHRKSEFLSFYVQWIHDTCGVHQILYTS